MIKCEEQLQIQIVSASAFPKTQNPSNELKYKSSTTDPVVDRLHNLAAWACPADHQTHHAWTCPTGAPWQIKFAVIQSQCTMKAYAIAETICARLSSSFKTRITIRWKKIRKHTAAAPRTHEKVRSHLNPSTAISYPNYARRSLGQKPQPEPQIASALATQLHAPQLRIKSAAAQLLVPLLRIEN